MEKINTLSNSKASCLETGLDILDSHRDFFNLFFFVLNCKQTRVDSSFVYLYLGKEKVGVFSFFYIYITFRNLK